MKLVQTMVSGLVVVAALGSATPVFAGASGNVGVTSDYIWRGTTQTNHQAAVSGGLDYGHDSGLYLSTWVSNVSWDGPDTEIDVIGGYAREFGGVGLDLGYIQYHYPQGADFAEVYVGASYSMVGATYYYNMEDENAWLEASADFEVKKGLSLGVNFGMAMMKVSDADWMTYGANITKGVGDWEAVMAVSMTDMDAGLDSEPVATVSMSRSFDL